MNLSFVDFAQLAGRDRAGEGRPGQNDDVVRPLLHHRQDACRVAIGVVGDRVAALPLEIAERLGVECA